MRRWTLPSRAERGRVILSGVWTTSTCYKPREIERDALVAGRRGERAAGPALDPAAERASEALCGPSSPVDLHRWLGVLYPSDSRDLSRSCAHGHGWTAPATSLAQRLDCPSRQALRAAACRRDRAPHRGRDTGTRGDAQASLA